MTVIVSVQCTDLVSMTVYVSVQCTDLVSMTVSVIVLCQCVCHKDGNENMKKYFPDMKSVYTVQCIVYTVHCTLEVRLYKAVSLLSGL